MNTDELIELLAAWLNTKPTARGLPVVDAEVRLKASGAGRFIVELGHSVERQLHSLGRWPADKAAPPNLPVRARADFSSVAELASFLEGAKECPFYFDDEAPGAGGPLE